MLSCIVCRKRLDEEGCGTSRSPASRDRNTVKNLTAQPNFNNALEQMEEEEEGKEWISHVEPGIIFTLFSLKGGGNELKRIRFSREMFNKARAQLWWAENQEKVSELYNIPPNAQRKCGDLFRSDKEEREAKIQEAGGENSPVPPQPQNILPRPMDASTPSGCRDADRSDDLQSSSDNQPIESATNSSKQTREEWVEEDEPGVYIIFRSSPTGTRRVKLLKFSREKFSEMQARLWWEANRSRIQEQYINGHGM